MRPCAGKGGQMQVAVPNTCRRSSRWAGFEGYSAADTQTVAPETAVAVVIVALLVGWYGRMWREREGDRSVTRTRAANARKAAWHARWVMVVMGIVVLAIIDVLLHGGGR